MKSKLQDVFSNWISNGIFYALNNYDVPWKNDVAPATLDAEYFGNISGCKNLSPLVSKLLNIDGANVLSDTRINQLALILFNLNGANWSREYATLDMEYNPISNYDMTETETESGTNSNTRTNTGTQTDARTESGTTTASGTGSDSVYGFNSANAVPDSESTTGSSATASNTINETRTDDLTQGDAGTHSGTRSLSRSGNIGVTTSQQMIQSERELYVWNFFYKVVFPSVDRTLTIATYSDTYIPQIETASAGGGGGNAEIMEKLTDIELNINQLRASTFNGFSNTNTKIDSDAASINLSINQLRASTFAAIDGVETRNY